MKRERRAITFCPAGILRSTNREDGWRGGKGRTDC